MLAFSIELVNQEVRLVKLTHGRLFIKIVKPECVIYLCMSPTVVVVIIVRTVIKSWRQSLSQSSLIVATIAASTVVSIVSTIVTVIITTSLK